VFPFAKDFTYTFTPEVDGDPVTLPSQTPAIYIFDSRPSRDNVLNGTGSPVQTITTWDETDGYKRLISVDGISDPNPTSESTSENYWIGIKFKLDTSEDYQAVIFDLLLERVAAHQDEILTSISRLKDIYPDIDTYANEEDCVGFIDKAKEHVEGNLTAKGYVWAQIKRLKTLSLIVDYRALMLFANTQRGDLFKDLRAEWKQEAQEMLANLKLDYDADGDGSPEEPQPIGSDILLSR
jgi:hypothetical protein